MVQMFFITTDGIFFFFYFSTRKEYISCISCRLIVCLCDNMDSRGFLHSCHSLNSEPYNLFLSCRNASYWPSLRMGCLLLPFAYRWLGREAMEVTSFYQKKNYVEKAPTGQKFDMGFGFVRVEEKRNDGEA